MIGSTLPIIMRLKWPNLSDENHLITSLKNNDYNCIAWAYKVSNKWMWPGTQDAFWPSNLIDPDELNNMIQLYMDNGYEKCDSPEKEDGFEKVAIYVDEERRPKHAARQLESGRWTSKLGGLEDIEHDTLEALEGDLYGKAEVFLRKHNV